MLYTYSIFFSFCDEGTSRLFTPPLCLPLPLFLSLLLAAGFSPSVGIIVAGQGTSGFLGE